MRWPLPDPESGKYLIFLIKLINFKPFSSKCPHYSHTRRILLHHR